MAIGLTINGKQIDLAKSSVREHSDRRHGNQPGARHGIFGSLNYFQKQSC